MVEWIADIRARTLTHTRRTYLINDRLFGLFISLEIGIQSLNDLIEALVGSQVAL